jgi:hypothetical protein
MAHNGVTIHAYQLPYLFQTNACRFSIATPTRCHTMRRRASLLRLRYRLLGCVWRDGT